MVSVPKASKIFRSSKEYTFEMYLQREEQAAEKHEFYLIERKTPMPSGSEMEAKFYVSLVRR